MAHVSAIDGLRPVHPAAVLIGDLIVGPNCYDSPGARPRLDVIRYQPLYEACGE